MALQYTTEPQQPTKGKQQQPESKPQDSGDDALLEKNSVSAWIGKVKSAKQQRKNDYKRMRDNMNFAAGLQWPGQKTMDDSRYVVNIVNKAVNEKVAMLYARNPQAEYQRRKRLDFQLYDGKLENLVPLVQQAMQVGGIMMLPPEQQALLADYMHGMQEREMIDRVGKTLEIVFQYQLDEQDEEEGEFKLQMKQLVRRVVTTSVGYVRAKFVRETSAGVTTTGAYNTVVNMGLKAKGLMEKAEKGELDRTKPQQQQLNELTTALGVAIPDRMAQGSVKEGMVFDFLPSTSVIPDPRCRQLKGFVGAKWIAIEYVLQVCDVNSIFGCDIKPSVSAKSTETGVQRPRNQAEQRKAGEELCVLYEVLNKETKTHCFVAEGFDKWVLEPQQLTPNVRGFWPVAALTFNDTEVEDGLPASIFPPSDVELMRHPQKEWNRSREELRKHRKANRPMYLAQKGVLTTDDKEAMQNASSNQVVELQGLTQGTDIKSVFAPRPQIPIDGALYDTSSCMQDIQMSIGSQSANLGPVPASATATGQTISEQSRMTVTSSNIDDLDDFLSTLARISGEMCLREMSVETVKQLAGPGAVWPNDPQQREVYLNHVYLITKAASSGRPNKVMELNNWRFIAPILQAAGANPQFLVRESIRRVDDQLDPEQAFPLVPPQSGGQQPPQGGKHQPGDQQQHVPGYNQPPQQAREQAQPQISAGNHASGQ